jgi:hypothetical protein
MYPNFTDHYSNSMSQRCNSILELNSRAWSSLMNFTRQLATTHQADDNRGTTHSASAKPPTRN